MCVWNIEDFDMKKRKIHFAHVLIISLLCVVAAFFVAVPLGICALVILQHGLRKNLRRKKLEKLPPNKQALRCWRYIRRGCRRSRHAPPEELQALANKAAFSQHTLTPEELEQFHGWLRDFKTDLLKRPIPLRWILKLIFAL